MPVVSDCQQINKAKKRFPSVMKRKSAGRFSVNQMTLCVRNSKEVECEAGIDFVLISDNFSSEKDGWVH